MGAKIKTQISHAECASRKSFQKALNDITLKYSFKNKFACTLLGELLYQDTTARPPVLR